MFAKTSATIVAVASLASLALGCSGASAAPPALDTSQTGAISSALDTANGGMTSADEQPAFGDPAVEAVQGFEATGADPQDMTVDSAALPGATSYHVALLWGHIPLPHDTVDADANPPKPIDWTGSVSIDAGAIGLKRTLAFDANDKVEARTDAKVVSFVSHTLPAVDGLFLRVVVPSGGSPLLHFKTVTLTYDVDLSTLAAKAGGVTRLPADSDAGLAFIGYPDVAGCARGLLAGRWLKARASLGGLRGRVIDDEGATIGHVRGIWGHAQKADKDLFFGKYIGVDGAARALFGGTYGGGEADGVWTTKDKQVGALQVFYSDGYDKADGRGLFLGRWSEKCAQ